MTYAIYDHRTHTALCVTLTNVVAEEFERINPEDWR